METRHPYVQQVTETLRVEMAQPTQAIKSVTRVIISLIAIVKRNTFVATKDAIWIIS